jgi:hypothetical protein
MSDRRIDLKFTAPNFFVPLLFFLRQAPSAFAALGHFAPVEFPLHVN